MKISSVVDIVGGKLQNKPSISFFTQSHTKLKKIKDGDLFISSSLEDILSAIKNGAFGIVYDFEIDISKYDNEIAWIKVDSIQKAIVKLLRFELSNKELLSYSLDSVSYEILKLLNPYKDNILFLEDSMQNNLELINNLENKTILVSKNHTFLTNIYPKTKQIVLKNYNLKNLTIHSIFETSFSYMGKLYYKLKISKLYINNLLTIIELFKIQEIDNQKLKSLQYMQPIFINKNLNLVEFGKTNRFIIANQDKNITLKEIEFLYEYFKYGKIFILDATDLLHNNIYDIIKNKSFNCLYIKGKNLNEIKNILESNKIEEKTLF